jgi:hypothetical protein
MIDRSVAEETADYAANLAANVACVNGRFDSIELLVEIVADFIDLISGEFYSEFLL